MPITGAFIMPHPPIILPQVGGGEERKIQSTADSCVKIAERIAAIKPETIVLTSPHSIMYADYFHISPGTRAKGNLRRFGVDEGKFQIDLEYDCDFVSKLQAEAMKNGIPAGTQGERDAALDHGTVVPLAFILEQYSDFKLVRIGLSGLPYADHYELGKCIANAADASGKNVVFIASGDLSHKASHQSHYGFVPEGPLFDKQVTDAMSSGDFLKFLTFGEDLAEKAAECGLRSFIIMAGALDGKDVKSELHSYEATFGVGYGAASFIPRGENESRKFLGAYKKLENSRLEDIKTQEDEYVKLARYSVENYVKTGKIAQEPRNLPDDMTGRRAGVFVSLKKHGNLRGCIGTISPVTKSIAEEILRNAVSAAAEDPRFDPVRASELPELVYSVDVLSPSEPVSSTDFLDSARYGVIVTSGHKRGLLLPNLEGVDTPEQQIEIACRKAGIRDDETFKIERFEVVR
ncbi:MAG: AmmeMemoRadiSam system protein A, partial [Synergistaceae bacterium]|nr:AmmeMemoRadiSam system protein A [Synergistaceae bacterium]